MYRLDPGSKVPLYMQLYEQIRSDIEQGRTASGSMLMSSRRMAETLGVSRNTVDQAYEKLLSEGFIVSSPRRGYYAERTSDTRNDIKQQPEHVLYDFTFASKCSEGFPMGKWRLCANKALMDSDTLLKDPEPFGDRALRGQISGFLYRYRGISCKPDEVFVFGSPDICMASALGLAGANKVYAANPLENEKKMFKFLGIDTAESTKNGACLYISPFMHCLNAAGTEEKARKDGVWIIENGRGFLYAQNGRITPDPRGKTIYLGTFSELIFPGIKTAYMVLPPDTAKKMREEGFPTSSGDLQRAISLFMCDRNWGSYLNKMVRNEQGKARLLENELNNAGIAAECEGACVYLEKNTAQIDAVIGKARAAGLLTERFTDGICLSCGGIKKADIAAAAALLANVLKDEI